LDKSQSTGIGILAGEKASWPSAPVSLEVFIFMIGLVDFIRPSLISLDNKPFFTERIPVDSAKHIIDELTGIPEDKGSALCAGFFRMMQRVKYLVKA
jgi:hypothetical protein